MVEGLPVQWLLTFNEINNVKLNGKEIKNVKPKDNEIKNVKLMLLE